MKRILFLICLIILLALPISAQTVDANHPVGEIETFTFTGTGFDILTDTGPHTGFISIEVYDTNNNRIRYWACDTYYSFETLHKVPVVHCSDEFAYGTYTVNVKPMYSKLFDHSESGYYDFIMDGYTIYNDSATYLNLHDVAKSGATFVDEQGEITDFSIYNNIGPNNEVYLVKNQQIIFDLSSINLTNAKVEIGLRAPTKVAMCHVGAASYKIHTPDEYYYDITKEISNNKITVVADRANHLLSMTNLRITYLTPIQMVKQISTVKQETLITHRNPLKVDNGRLRFYNK